MDPESQTTTPASKETASSTPASLGSLASSTLALQESYSPGYDTTTAHKYIVVFTTSFITLAACFSSTSLFSAADRIAQDFGTTTEIINISSAAVLLTMGLSNFVWGPISTLCGRLYAYNACIVVLLLFTMAAALAPNLETFIAVRVLLGFQGTFFHVAGQTILAEHFRPTERGTATGFFLCGTVLGPPLGPLIAGIVVTYTSWRVILWTQVGMIGLALVLSLCFLRKGGSPPEKPTSPEKVSFLLHVIRAFNPGRVFRLMLYPNVLLTDIACGLLSWCQYSLLSSPRHILVSQYHLNSPLISGLFYLSPAAGFLLGTLIGGRYSDRTVKEWIKRRDGIRLPQDRLRSGFASWLLVIPVSSLIFGWTVQENAGGLAMPIVFAFLIAAGLLAAFAGLNTYCAEVIPSHRQEVIGSKYLVQYTFSALASGGSIPMIDAIGVGMQSTISVILVLVGGGLCIITALYGINMQVWVDRKLAKS